MARQKGGSVEADRTYTHHALGEVLGRTPDWVKENIIEIEGGCYAWKIAHTYYVSGQSFQQWIEANSTPHAPTGKKVNAKKTVGNEA